MFLFGSYNTISYLYVIVKLKVMDKLQRLERLRYLLLVVYAKNKTQHNWNRLAKIHNHSKQLKTKSNG